MMHRFTHLSGLALLVAAGLVLGGCEVETEDAGEMEMDTVTQEQPVTAPGAGQQPAEVYEARLDEVEGSGVTGTATVTVEDDQLQVTVAATGLDPDTRVPMHIHMNASCDDAGGILLNLDEGLTAANEGGARGEAYPQSDAEGRLEYAASRSLEELRTAMREQGAEQADSLDLGNRVVNLHGPEMQSISCGPLEQTGMGAGSTTDTADTAGQR